MKSFETTRYPRVVRTAGLIEEEAAAWVDRLQDNQDLQVFEAFEQWRTADAEHARAYERVNAAYSGILDGIGGWRALSEMESQTMTNVAAHARHTRRRLGVVLAGLAASVVAVIAFTGGSLSELQYLRDRAGHLLAGESLYRTAVGERLALPLDDGSLLTLNTDTRVVVRYRDHVRGVTLLRGQALFEVAKDASRPFVVTAGERTVTALGTAFDVRLSDSRFEVTMLEGRVVVARQPEHAPIKYASVESMAAPTELGAGDQLLASATVDGPVVRKTDARRITSWREGQIIFDNDALDYAVSELNRYGRQKLVLSDPRLADLRVSGAFYTRSSDVFIDMLTVHFPVRVQETSDDRIVLSYDS